MLRLIARGVCAIREGASAAAKARGLYVDVSVAIARKTPHRIGELCLGGDWACAHGDLEGLAHIVQQLARHLPERLHDELEELVRTCYQNPERATEKWFELKERRLWPMA